MEVYFEIPPENKRHATVGKHQFYRPNSEARQLGKPALSSHPKYARKQKKNLDCYHDLTLSLCLYRISLTFSVALIGRLALDMTGEVMIDNPPKIN